MEATNRYRLLIYVAALILCLSVCFANAEEVNGPEPAVVHQAVASQTMIFQSSHTRATFMPALQQSFLTPIAITTAEAHVVPQSVLQQVNEASRSHHFWHGSAKHRTSLVLNHQVSASSGGTKDLRDLDVAGQSE